MPAAYGKTTSWKSFTSKNTNSSFSQTLYKRENMTGLIGRSCSMFIDDKYFKAISEYDPGFNHIHSVRLWQVTSRQFFRPQNLFESVTLEELLALLDANVQPSVEIIISITQKCKKEKNLCSAMHVLVYIHCYGLENHEVVGNYIVPMLVECGSIAHALSIFHKLIFQNECTWMSLIHGYIDSGELQLALNVYWKMQLGPILPSMYTLQSLVKACARLRCIEAGREMHIVIAREGYEKDLIVGNTLVDLYAKSGVYEEAWSVLTELPVRDTVSWNALIGGYAEHGFGEAALDCVAQMKSDGASPDEVTFLCGLKGCRYVGVHKVLELHAEIVTEGFDRYPFVGNCLVDLYGKGGLLLEAMEVFLELSAPDVVSWNALITGYAEHGYSEEALVCLDRMRMVNVCPDNVTYVCSLKACGSPEVIGGGHQVHSQIVKEGYESLSCIGNMLVDMYARNGWFLDARKVFQGLAVKDVVSWTSLISGCADNGLGEEGLTCWEQMCLDGFSPNIATFVCSLKNCCIIGALEKGLTIHTVIAVEGFEKDPFICSSLVDMYAKNGSFAEADDVFKEMPDKDIVVWTALIAGHTEWGSGELALKFLNQMLLEGLSPNRATFLSTLRACGSLENAERGRQLHGMIIKAGLEKEHVLNNTLVGMYSKCGLFYEAGSLFDKSSDHSTALWNVLISGYADNGLGEDAWNCLQEMRAKGIPPNEISLVCTLKGCGNMESIHKVQHIHLEIVKLGYENINFASNSLINVYAKGGLLREACTLFTENLAKDGNAWNAFMLGYAEYGQEKEVLNLSEQLQGYSISPNAVTFLCTLKACASLSAKAKGRETHAEIVKKGFDSHPYIGSSLVDFYSKCGLLSEARSVFDNVTVKSVNAWTALLTGYAEQGLSKESLKCLNQMKLEGVSPTCITFLCSLRGWCINGRVEGARELHSEVIKYGSEKDPLIGSALVDLYGKCSLVLDAQKVFDGLSVRLVVSWTSLIAAYAERGCLEKALYSLEKMHLDGLCPDALTYLCSLKACTSLGVVDKGQALHVKIVQKGFDTYSSLCGALVDYYGKCGLLADAWEVFNHMPVQDSASWNALLVSFATKGESENVFTFLERMCDAGNAPDEITLLSILTVCNYVGLVDIGLCYFKAISKDFGVNATVAHNNCLLDLLGRAGQLNKAFVWADCMPHQPDFITWKTVLGACTKYSFLESARQAFMCAVQLDEQQAVPFVLMSNIVASFASDHKATGKEEACLDSFNSLMEML